MEKLRSKDWWLEVIERMIKTFAQVLVSLLTVGKALTDFDWISMLSIAATSAVISFLTSLATIDDPSKYIDVSYALDDNEEMDEEIIEDEEDE